MSVVTQINLFSEEENLGELEKLAQILSVLPAEKLLKKLDEERENGRNDYPVVCMWRLLLAKNIFQHETIESLLRESCSYSAKLCCDVSLYKKLKEHQEELTEMMVILEKKLQEELPDFGKEVAIDGKMIQSYASEVNIE